MRLGDGLMGAPKRQKLIALNLDFKGEKSRKLMIK